MEADCSDTLGSIGSLLNGGMALTASTWSDVGREFADFEDDAICSTEVSSCDSAVTSISNIKIFENVHNEEPEPEENVLPITAASSLLTDDTKFFINGIQDKMLETVDRSLYIGDNNRAFFLYSELESTDTAYYHPYLGGSVTFDVDVSDVGCGCRAGVYLTTLNEDTCTWDPYLDSEPACSTIEIMEASAWNFSSRTSPCEYGLCPEEDSCSAATTGTDIGPGITYTIDSSRSFSVKVEFWADEDENGDPIELLKIVTTLSQDGKDLVLNQDCESLAGLTEDLRDW